MIDVRLQLLIADILLQTNETELQQFFTVYGAVKDCKIIVDRGGISKRCYLLIVHELQHVQYYCHCNAMVKAILKSTFVYFDNYYCDIVGG